MSSTSLLAKFFVTLCIGLAAYSIATTHLALWITIAILLPLTLLIIHWFIRPVFLPIFGERKLITAK